MRLLWSPAGVETATLTAYPVEGRRPSPAVVVCPGGGYRRHAPHEGEPVARWLHGLGIGAFVLAYRVWPHHHPAPLEDARRAIQTIRRNADEWGVDRERVGVLGFSAGGHLASTIATHWDRGDPDAADPLERESCRPDAVVLCYPVVTFGPHRHEGSMIALLGEDPPAYRRELLSNELQVRDDTPPAFIWHTADDGSVPVENSLLFANALRARRVPFELHVFPHGAHGLGMAEDEPPVRAWTDLCATWLRGLGWVASPPGVESVTPPA